MNRFICFILCFLCFPAYAKLEVYFTPSKKCEDSIVNLINKSQKSIDATVYSINNRQIVNAIVDAHNRGIKLRILTDKQQAANKNSKVLDLYKYGVNIKVNNKYKSEHNKFAVFDGKTVFTGSFNWTNPASERNSENCLFVSENKAIVSDYQQRFNELWYLNSQAKSNEWLSRRIIKCKK